MIENNNKYIIVWKLNFLRQYTYAWKDREESGGRSKKKKKNRLN